MDKELYTLGVAEDCGVILCDGLRITSGMTVEVLNKFVNRITELEAEKIKGIKLKGWISKDDFKKKKFWNNWVFQRLNIYKKKDKPIEWASQDWPPIKVEIIIRPIKD